MIDNIVIDVGLGIILMYLMLSLMCTVVNEYIAGWTSLRASTLAQGVKNLIDDPNVHAAFYSHGLIDSVSKATGGKPSYLAAKPFASALLESLNPHQPIAGIADVQAALATLPSSNIKDVVRSAVSTANGDLTQLRNTLAAWFDDSMDRVSGIYKRDVRIIAFLVGVAIAIVLNADTFAVGTALWNDGALRAQIVKEAEATVSDSAGQQDRVTALERDQAALRPFPVGWNTKSLDLSRGWSWTSAWVVVVKMIGLLITGLALSLGAPFWFDLLNKFINIRAAGTKPKPVNQDG